MRLRAYKQGAAKCPALFSLFAQPAQGELFPAYSYEFGRMHWMNFI
jgi:hypothetical protein